MTCPVRVVDEQGKESLGWLYTLPSMPRANQEFLDALPLAEGQTGMDPLRLSCLWAHVLSTKKCVSGAMIEIGCGRGGSGLIIARARTLAGITEDLHLVDTFAGIVGSSAIDHHKDGEMNEATPEETVGFLSRHGEAVCVWKAVYPDPSVFPGPFRFAHIDTDTYKSTAESLDFLIPKMVRGGIIMLDDYGIATTPGVTKAVNERADWGEVRWIFPSTNQAIAVVL